MAAAKVGGILNNNLNRAQFIYENTSIQNNLIHGSYLAKVKKLIFLGSSCIYPKYCKQPMKEEYLLSGKLETTNEPYAIAKIHGMKMCENYNKQYKTNYFSIMHQVYMAQMIIMILKTLMLYPRYKKCMMLK